MLAIDAKRESMLRALRNGEYLCEHGDGYTHIIDRQDCGMQTTRTVYGPMTAEIRKKAVEMGLM